MNAVAVDKRKKKSLQKDAALSFINSIESTWKGHQNFACWLVQFLKPKTIVDLGFDRGLSALSFAYRNKGDVFAIDWFEEVNYATKCFALDSAFRNISNAIRFNYVKNIHLFVGPFADIAKKWVRKIDILHIDGAHSYSLAKKHFDHWKPFLTQNSVILIHDILAFPDETGQFFQDLEIEHKITFLNAQGLGVASKNETLIQEIKTTFAEAL